ncbi:hypothetical protein Plhal304r1_c090g0171471 [Plasmopara halstedii]
MRCSTTIFTLKQLQLSSSLLQLSPRLFSPNDNLSSERSVRILRALYVSFREIFQILIDPRMQIYRHRRNLYATLIVRI